MVKIKPVRIIKFVVLVLFISAGMFLVFYFDLSVFFSPEKIDSFVSKFGILAPIAYIAVYITATLFFLPDALLTIAGGSLFGKFEGMLYSMIGVIFGAVIAFLLARYLGRGFVEKWIIKKSDFLEKYDKKLRYHGVWVMLFFRLIPFFPYNSLNFALGLTNVRFWDYFIATIIGLIPGTFFYSYFGEAL
ncbi:hypothetical protein GF327_06090, partial [Candidatus Woesearchaeota archaeon]|nr:hypothetical protein [Candidatus Woesearchaeota archaeon]